MTSRSTAYSSRRRRPNCSATSCAVWVPTSTSGTSPRRPSSVSRRFGSGSAPTRWSASKPRSREGEPRRLPPGHPRLRPRRGAGVLRRGARVQAGAALRRPHHDRLLRRPAGVPSGGRRPSDARAELTLYPRHFGVTFREARDFDALHELCVQRKIELFCRRQHPLRGAGGGAPDLRAARPLGQPHRVQALRRPADDVLRWRQPSHRCTPSLSGARWTTRRKTSASWCADRPPRSGRRFTSRTRGVTPVLTFGVLEHWRIAFARSPLPPGATVALSVSDPLRFAAAFVGAMASGLVGGAAGPGVAGHGAERSGIAGGAGRGPRWSWPIGRPPPACRARWVELASLAPGHVGGPSTRPVRRPSPRPGASCSRHRARRVRPRWSACTRTSSSTRRVAWSTHHGLAAARPRLQPAAPLPHQRGGRGIALHALAGSCLVLDDRFHRSGFWELMGERRVTWINAVPAIISRLAELRPGETVPPGIRFVRSASAPLPVARGRSVRGGDGAPDRRDLRHDRGCQPDRGAPLVGAATCRLGGFAGGARAARRPRRRARCRGPTPCPPGQVGEVEIRGASVIERLRRGRARRSLPPGRLAAHGRSRPSRRRRLPVPGCPDRRRHQPWWREGIPPRDRRDPQRGPCGGLGRRHRPGRARAGSGTRGVRGPSRFRRR